MISQTHKMRACFPFRQVDNGIPIESWFDDDTDEELLNVLPFLQSLTDAADVRPLVRRQFGMQALIDGL